MTAPLGYVNGRFLPLPEIVIPLDDAGFVWGATVTDRARTFGGRLFRLDEHLARFRRSCGLARVPLRPTNAELAEVSRRLVTGTAAGTELTLVWVATPGPPGGDPTLIVHTQPVDVGRTARLHASGARLVTAAVGPAVDPRIKHRSRLNWWIATQDVRAGDAEAEPLLVDPSTGHVLETPTANLLSVHDGVVTSPPAGTVLPGVSLDVVRELCQTRHIPFAERALTVADLGRASEVLLTNTTYCMAGVSRIDGRPVPFPGPILNRLLDAWSELVGTPIRPPAES